MKRLSIILIIFVILLASIMPSCFASSQITIDDKNIILSDDMSSYEYKFISIHFAYFKGTKNYQEISFQFYFSNSPLQLVRDTSYDKYDKFYSYNVKSIDDSSIYYYYGGGTSLSSLANSNPIDFSSVTLKSASGYGFYHYTNYDTSLDYKDYVYTSHEIKDDLGNTVFSAPFVSPSFITTQEELESGKFESLRINSGDFNTYDNEEFYLFSYYYSGDVDDVASIYPRHEILLNGVNSNYFVGANSNGNYIYEIPFSQLGIDLVEGKKYGFKLASKNSDSVVTDYWESVVFTIGVVSAEDVTNNKLDEQTDAIKENTETNKGIWETIKDIVSYINPFSENFFVYKLISLLVDALKSLFIPSDEFLSTFFSDLKDWFSDRLGFLFYPFELILDILNKMLNINFSNPVFNIPDVHEPFTNKLLIGSTTYNLNDMLENSAFKTIHDIYLVIVDAFVIFGLVNLAKRKWEEVTSQ